MASSAFGTAKRARCCRRSGLIAGAAWAVAALRTGDVASGGADKIIRVWRKIDGAGSTAAAAAAAGGGRLVGSPTLTINTAEMVCSLAELRGGVLAAGLFGRGGIEIWRITPEQQGTLLSTLPAQGWSVWSLCELPGDVLASGHGEGAVCTWDITDLANPKQSRALAAHNGAVHVLCLLLNGQLMSAGHDGRVFVW